MKGKKNTMILNLSNFDSLKILKDEQLGRLFRALYGHYRGEKCVIEDDIVWPYRWLTTEIDRYNQKYIEVCALRSMAGKKGNDVRWHSQNIAKLARVADNDYENEKENEKEIFEIKKIFLFEKGCFSVKKEFDRFIAHYEKSGWLDGNGVPITNKLACAKCWTPQYKDDVEKNNALGYAKCWKSLYDLLADKEDCVLLITDVYRISSHYSKVHICISRLLYDFLKTNYDEKVDAVLKSFGQAIEWKVYDPK